MSHEGGVHLHLDHNRIGARRAHEPPEGRGPEPQLAFNDPPGLGTQRVGVLIELPRILAELGVDPSLALENAGVQAEVLQDTENQLSFAAATQLVASCAARTGREDFGLLLGSAARLRHLGIVGDLLRASATLGSALIDFVDSHGRYVRGAATYLIDWPDNAVLGGYRAHQAGSHGVSHFSVGAVAFGFQVFHELCGVRPTIVLLAIPRPLDARPYFRAFAGSEIEFGAEHYGLVYSEAALRTPIPTADARAHGQLRAAVAQHWSRILPDVQDQVLRVLVPSVLSGSHSLASIARRIGMHPRSLNRALQAEGTTFRAILNRARFEMASQLLVDTHVSIRDVANIMGYSEVSAFTRFFASIAGAPPAEWRDGHDGVAAVAALRA